MSIAIYPIIYDNLISKYYTELARIWKCKYVHYVNFTC